MFASDDEGELAGDAGDGTRSPDPAQRQNVASFDEDSGKKKQGCGSALFFCGSGCSSSSQWGSGSSLTKFLSKKLHEVLK